MANRALYFPRLERRKTYSTFSAYREYRQEIREDCQGRCVYCDAHENEIGGAESMTLDHFRPKDKFGHLAHDPSNLVWSCQTCNRNKSNYWPAIGTTSTFVKRGGFVDPFTEDMHEYFSIEASGELIPLKRPARYLIQTLKLNRQGVKVLREARRVLCESRAARLRKLSHYIRELDDELEQPDLSARSRGRLSAMKAELSEEYDEILAEERPDFRLR